LGIGIIHIIEVKNALKEIFAFCPVNHRFFFDD